MPTLINSYSLAPIIGINTYTPNKTLTVNGEVSAASAVWADTYHGDGSNLTGITQIKDWMTLVRGYKTTPILLATIGTGDVYTYVYSTATTDKTYYRYIATDGSEDSFYGNFTNPTLSNLIATKKIIL